MRHLTLIAILLAAALTLPVHADNVLVFQQFTADPTPGANMESLKVKTTLEAAGHTVTLAAGDAAVLPADLSPFDAVWVVQLPSFPLLESKLIAFVRGGGGLYMSGERNPCLMCSARESVQNILANLLLHNVDVGTTHTDGVDFVPGASPPFGLTTTPNVLTSFTAILSGFLGRVPADRVVFETAAHDVGAAAFGPEDLRTAGGCLYVNMDLSFLDSESIPPTYPLQTALLENIERFLGHCTDADRDGITDQSEAELGTDPHDPDTDGDGLCDGYRTVPGVCVAGEDPHSDPDGDGIIGPLDPDDDGDGIPTKVELVYEQQFPNLDGDFIPMWLDRDSDHDGVPDRLEAVDFNHDGIPAFADRDDVPDACRTDVPGGCPAGFSCAAGDSDPRYGYCEPGGAGTTTTTISGATTTTVPGPTTTTLPTGDVEVCGNCLDDDGNGLTDLDDPACCAARTTVTLKRGRFAAAKTTGTKLTVKGLVPGTRLVGATPLPDVVVQIGRAGESPLLCARIPGENQIVKKTKLRFKDKKHTVASARGIDVLKVIDTRKGLAKLAFKGKAVAMSAPEVGTLRVTVALDGPESRCVVADGSYRAAKKGIRFP